MLISTFRLAKFCVRTHMDESKESNSSNRKKDDDASAVVPFQWDSAISYRRPLSRFQTHLPHSHFELGESKVLLLFGHIVCVCVEHSNRQRCWHRHHHHHGSHSAESPIKFNFGCCATQNKYDFMLSLFRAFPFTLLNTHTHAHSLHLDFLFSETKGRERERIHSFYSLINHQPVIRFVCIAFECNINAIFLESFSCTTFTHTQSSFLVVSFFLFACEILSNIPPCFVGFARIQCHFQYA